MLQKLGLVQTLLGHPVGNVVLAVQLLLFAMNGGKHLAVQFVHLAHGFQRKIQTLQWLRVRPEGHGHPAHHHMGWHLLDPGLKRGLKARAMWAPVAKKLHHLDLAGWRVNGRWASQLEVIGPLFETFGLCQHGWGGQTPGGGGQGHGGSGKFTTTHVHVTPCRR